MQDTSFKVRKVVGSLGHISKGRTKNEDEKKAPHSTIVSKLACTIETLTCNVSQMQKGYKE